MSSRYTFRLIEVNEDKTYKELFDARGVSFIEQYTTPKLSYPTSAQIAELTMIGHIWTLGDRFYKLAHKHYGRSELWWIIAWFNQAPLEAQLKVGTVIDIPFPLERILRMLRI